MDRDGDMSATGWLRSIATSAVAMLIAVLGVGVDTGFGVPQRLPPSAGDRVPDVDTHARGRPADELRVWGTSAFRPRPANLVRFAFLEGRSEPLLGLDDATNTAVALLAPKLASIPILHRWEAKRFNHPAVAE